MDGFIISCKSCGAQLEIREGKRGEEKIRFGVDKSGETYITCECGVRFSSEVHGSWTQIENRS